MTRTRATAEAAPGLFEVDAPATGPADSPGELAPPTGPEGEQPAIFPPDVALADIRREMVEAGAPPGFLEMFDTFGDDRDGLTAWLREVGFGISPAESVLRVLENWRPLLKRSATPLDAELCGAEFLALFEAAVGDAPSVQALSELIATATDTGTKEALAMCRVLAYMGPAEVRAPAATAAHQLASEGAKDMPWAHRLGRAEFEDAFGYADPAGEQQTLAVQFAYGKRPHTCIILIDHGLGGGVKDLWVTDECSETRNGFQFAAIEHGFTFNVHTAQQAATILHAALAAPACPVDPEQIEDVGTYLPLLQMRAHSLPAPAVLRAIDPGPAATPHTATRIHRIKVTLAGSKPPIWRRLEVPSSTSLADLHEILQVAFDWDGGHLWVFETSKGEFGEPGTMGHLNAAGVTLGALAPRQGAKFRYVYDFGDNWEHSILVEEIAAARDGAMYPRCTAGRRAAPPEDCGGIWGYAEIVDILADTENPEHGERLEWLGFDSAAEFDPVTFSPDEVNEILHD